MTDRNAAKKLHSIIVPAWVRDWIVNEAGRRGMTIQSVTAGLLIDSVKSRKSNTQ